MIDELKDAYLFTHLDTSQLKRVHAMRHPIALGDGDVLFRLGDSAQRFFLVIEGRIKLSRVSSGGNEKVFEIVQPGHTFGEALMFLEQSSYPINATALGSTRLLGFDSKAFVALLRESVDTCFMLLAGMSQRLHAMIDEIDDITLQSATCRTATMLVSHLTDPRQTDFRLCAPKSVLASRCSVKPETFSRILHSLSSAGVISVHGSCITVHAPEQLRLLAANRSYSEPSPHVAPVGI